MLHMRTDMDHDMVPPLVRLRAALDIAPIVRNQLAAIRQSAGKGLEERLIEFKPGIQLAPGISLLAEVFQVNTFVCVEDGAHVVGGTRG